MIKYLKIIVLSSLMILSTPLLPVTINYAPGIDPTSFDRLHPRLKDIALFIAGFCEQHRIKFVITSTIRSKERNAAIKAVSMTHVEGRAFDMSIRPIHGWTDELLMIMMQKVESRYGNLGAYTSSGKQLLQFNHDANNGTGYHLHYQVYKGLPWK